MNRNYEILDSKTGLETTARYLEKEKVVAVDLEADSMYHFKEKICLIQMATKRETIVIDPLRIGDLSPLKSLFSRRDIRKIFHGADYDIRSLYRDYKITVNNLFDTELACRFLGIKETSLESVLKQFFNVNLNKRYQKKDWSKRPLPWEMVDYAARDVKYLVPMYEILEKELAGSGRLTWMHEECESLSNVRSAVNDDQPLFLKFKGAGRLKPRNLAVLEAVLQFRKRIAEEKDRPLFKIFGNAAVMKIAAERPVTLRRLKDLKALSPKQISMYGKDLIEAATRALEIPGNELPVYPRKKAPVRSPRVPARVKVLKKWRDRKAEELGLEPSFLFNKALITAIAVSNPPDLQRLETIEDMKSWQKQAFGEEIVAVLQNR